MNNIASPDRPSRGRLTAGIIVLIYAAVGGLWIAASDSIVNMMSNDPEMITRFQTYKGWFYIGLTAVMLYWLIRRHGDERSRSEEKFKVIFDNAIDGILLADAETRKFYVGNEMICRMLGYTLEEINRLGVSDIHPEKDLPYVVDQFERQSKKEFVLARDIPMKRKDGSVFHADINSTPVTLSGKSYLMGVFKDVTERRAAEDALRKSEEKFRLLTESALVGVYLIQDGRFAYVNPALASIFGYTTEELIGKAGPSDLTATEDRALVMENIRKRVEGDTPYVSYSFRGLRKDGAGIDARVLGSRVEYNGRPAVLGTLLDITEQKEAEQNIQRQFRRMTALRSIDMAISSSLDLGVTLHILLEQVIAQLNVDAADVLLLDPHTMFLNYAAGRGFRTGAVEKTRIRPGQGLAGKAAMEYRTVSIPNIAEGKEALTFALADEGFRAYFAVPLIAKGQMKGILEIFHRTPLEPDAEWVGFLELLGGQAAIAVDNVTMFDNLQRSNMELTIAYDRTIEGWSRALDYRDRETEGHSQRATELTVEIARAMGVPEDELAHVRRGALLHDIGKLGVPDAILFKPGKLDDEEWDVMKKHPVFAYELLSPIPFLRLALEIPYCHHEKWDGTGYPRGLRGEEIPLAARIFAVVDVWDALLSDRPYRPAWPENAALEHISNLSGTHFDPEVVEAFLALLESRRGTHVELT